MSIIKLDNVNLFFRVRRDHRIKDLLIHGSQRFNDFGQDGSIHAIRNMNLTINDGERVAVIGHNGAGKSTLLKMISGIYPPASGTITVDGRISSMFELATGFEMESSGWENIYLRGLMLGESPSSIKSKLQSIAEFSELGDFLNMPVKYYSSGMFLRLAFSISTAIQPAILLLDEVVAAGDAAFLEKATQRMKVLVNVSKIMVLVTHSMASAIDMCNRCIWLERGSIVMDGNAQAVTNAYIKAMQKENKM